MKQKYKELFLFLLFDIIRKIITSNNFIYTKEYIFITMSIQGATNIDDLPQSNNSNVTMNVNEINQPVQNSLQGQGQGQTQTQPQIQNNSQSNNQNTIVSNPPQYNPGVDSGNNGQNNQQQINGQNLSQDDINKIVNGIQTASTHNMTALPTRDVPMNTFQHTNDPTIQPNYIPQPSTTTDYIKQQENMEVLLEKHKLKEKKDKHIEDLYDNLQTPLLITLLFFLFQLPFVNKNLYHYIPNLFIKDGHLSIGGYLFKSFMFGLIFIGLTKSVNYLSVV